MSDQKGRWLRPAGAQRCSYRFQCSVCGKVVYQVTGNNGRKEKDKDISCTYPSCPYCKSDMSVTGKQKRKYRVTFIQRHSYDVEVTAAGGTSDFAKESEAEDKAFELFCREMEKTNGRTSYDSVDVKCLDEDGTDVPERKEKK